MSDPPTEALAAVLASGSDTDLAAWASTGRVGVQLLRGELAGSGMTEPARPTHPRDVVDNLSAAVAAIASAEPDAFLAAFDGDEWTLNAFVLVGLGRIDDEDATARLIEAAVSADESARMHAAIGLAGRRSETVSRILGRLLHDSGYLVRYHALASLSSSGTPAALPDLEQFDPTTDIERAMRDEAMRRITGQASQPSASRASD